MSMRLHPAVLAAVMLLVITAVALKASYISANTPSADRVTSYLEAYAEALQRANTYSYFAKNVRDWELIASSMAALEEKNGAKAPVLSRNTAVDLPKAKEFLGALLANAKDLTSEQEIFRVAVAGLLSRFDPHAVALTPLEQQFYQLMSGLFDAGNGAILDISENQKNIYVFMVVAESPAEEQGIKAGDIILAVNGQPIMEVSENAIMKIERESWNKGAVTYKLQRHDKIFEVTTRFLKPEQPRIEKRLLEDGVGYIRIKRMKIYIAFEVMDAVQEFLEKGVRKLVLDLRSNPGGSGWEAVIISSIFKQGDFFIVKHRSGTEIAKSMAVPVLFSGPIALLVDRWTESAAETVTLALKERARIFSADPATRGKFTQQIGFSLSNQWLFYFTVSEKCSLKNECFNTFGIKPHELVDQETLLSAAVRWLRTK